MSKVVRIPPKVEARDCPGCGYRTAQQIVYAARYNYQCPRCGKHRFSEFKPVPHFEPPAKG